MRALSCVALLVLGGWAQPAGAQTALPQDVPNAAPNQWFTGSLEAPSPALPKAGMLAIEPYVVWQADTGTYGDNGHRTTGGSQPDTLEALLVIKYGITNRLTIQALPALSHTWDGAAHSTGAGFGDLPLELEYRLRDGNYRNGAPSITLDLGVTVPSGAYKHLSNSLNGVGQGAWLLKQGIVLQSLFDTAGNHPVRIRVYASMFEPLTHPSVEDVSVYGTTQGFAGKVAPGVSGQAGIGGGWALDRHWVFALDLVHTAGDRYRLTGIDGLGTPVKTLGADTSSTALAPAVEYNWSADAGVIAGVEFTAAGRNTPSYVAPQVAVAISF